MFRQATLSDLEQIAAIYDHIHTEEEAGRATVGWVRGVYPTRQTALDAIQAPMSLQEPVYNDGGDALYVMDQVSDTKNREEKWVEKLSLEAAMDHLDERERHIIRLRFFEGKTQMEVAEEIKISQAQVSRLEKNALRIMRQYLK